MQTTLHTLALTMALLLALSFSATPAYAKGKAKKGKPAATAQHKKAPKKNR